jgi:hypothetical protein
MSACTSLSKKEATRPPCINALPQQVRSDAFVQEFNAERPHQALDMQPPAVSDTASIRPYLGLPELAYPLHDRQHMVTAGGRIGMLRTKVNNATVLAGQRVGLEEVDDAIWLVGFTQYDPGYIDLEQKILEPRDNPFDSRLSPIS